MSDTLKALPVLAIDCQTTGNHPRNSHLLEIGWLCTRAGDPPERPLTAVRTTLVRLPPGQSVPKPVQKFTGIDPSQMASAVAPQAAWRLLAEDARLITAPQSGSSCPSIIHFSRFEIPFLKALHHESQGQAPFRLDVVCTHGIAARLLPDLPRKGLRAVAGYFGHSIPMTKRCEAHLIATAAIWHHLVRLLKHTLNITTWSQLQGWLSDPISRRSNGRTYPMPRQIRAPLPNAPGVYHFLRSNGDLLYIGKARSLRQRVNSYFQTSRRHSEKNLEMLSQAMDLRYFHTSTAVEAALLESRQIKAHLPPYNEALTAGNRSLAFVSPDFQHQSEQLDPCCRLGPVPSADLFTAVHLLGVWLEEKSPPGIEAMSPQLLGMPLSYCPSGECLMAGLELFKAYYIEILKRQGVWRGLLSIGRQAWLDRLHRKQTPAVEDRSFEPENRESKRDRRFLWSPENVVNALKSRLCSCAHGLRRARWLAMLSESSIVWKDADSQSERSHILVFEHGRIAEQCHKKSVYLPPVPPCHASSFYERKSHLDLEVYDSLRVLTTELRRLLVEKRFPAVCLKPGIVLDSGRLQALLRWI